MAAVSAKRSMYFEVSLCDSILTLIFFDNAVTFKIFLRCMQIAQSTNGSVL